jgi:hypothetical protein
MIIAIADRMWQQYGAMSILEVQAQAGCVRAAAARL